MTVERVGNRRPVLFAIASALVLIGLSPSAPAQTLESRVENLEVHDEILRSRQEVLTGDVNEFKAAVAGATATLRTEIAVQDAAVRADMATEDSAIRAEMATEDTAIRAEMAAIHSLPAADGDPANALIVDDTGNVGIGTITPQKRLHVAGDAIVAGNLDVSGEVRGILSADFDSGWFYVVNNNSYTQQHNLQLTDIPSIFQIYFSPVPNPVLGTNTIYLMNQAQYYSTSGGGGIGAFVQFVDGNTVNILTGKNYVLNATHAGGTAGLREWSSGYYRVKIWK